MEYTAIALPRFSLGKLSAIIDMVQGLKAASPTPTLIRSRNNCR